MNKTARIGTAVVGGYMLGRFKKARLAIAVGSAMMGKRLDLDVRRLARDGLRQLARSPQVAELTEQLRHDLVDAGRAAGMAAITRRAEHLTESLERRTAELQKAAAGPADDEPTAESEDGEPKQEERPQQKKEPNENGKPKQEEQPQQKKKPNENGPEQRIRRHATAERKAAAKRGRRAERSTQESGSATRPAPVTGRGSSTGSMRRQRAKSSEREGK